MTQQINLYQPIFRKQQILFSAQTIALVALGLLLILILWSVLIAQRVGGLESELERQQAAEQRAIAQIGELRRLLPEPEPSAELEQRLAELQQRRAELRQNLDSLARQRPVAETRLPQRFDALARQRPHGLWLTAVRMDARDDALIVQGRALSTRLIPSYLQALSAEPEISGTRFHQIRVKESDDELPGVRFLLSTRAEEDS